MITNGYALFRARPQSGNFGALVSIRDVRIRHLQKTGIPLRHALHLGHRRVLRELRERRFALNSLVQR